VGQVRHWGQIAETLPREDLYQLRSRIAYISPRQVLLHRLSLGENIALAPCYHQGYSESEALEPYTDLLEHLKLHAHLDQFPAQVSAAVYARAVWARELLKEPDLILAAIAGESATPAGAAMLFGVLQDYLAHNGAAALLIGKSLEPFYPLGHRLLRLESGQLLKEPILEHRARPLTTYLPLV
jgi:phospholipid/cholesterol/gamma-HCH transport system ATP-binding protein